MTKWLKKKKGWLNGYIQEKAKTILKDNAPYGIFYYPIKCPKCKTKNVKCYSVRPGVRYYRCKDCKWKFKAIEKD